jgi:hypothetical protein
LLLALASPISAQRASADKPPCAKPQVITDATYKPGQVWSYKTRTGESTSTITILKVETLPKIGTFIHVRIDGVQFKNCTGGPSPRTIDHAPFSKSAIDKSVLRQISVASTLPEFEEGYDDWLANCGGVYTITVAEMVEADDRTFSAGLGCKV